MVQAITSLLRALKFYPVFLLLISICLLFYTIMLKLKKQGIDVSLDYILLPLCQEIGIALFIVGTISIILETSDFKEYFLKRFTDFMTTNEFLKHLKEEKLISFKEELDKQLYGGDRDPSGIFCRVQQVITPFLKECYFEDYELTIHCMIETNENGKKIIKKSIHRRMVIVNPEHKSVLQVVPLGSIMQKIDGYAPDELYKIKMIKENSTDVTDKIICEASDIEEIDDNYNIAFSCTHPVLIPGKEKCTIEALTETKAPINDIHYWHKISKPCKQYRVSFILMNNDYILEGFGFGFMHGLAGNKKVQLREMVKTRLSNGLSIHFKDWILPGDGVIFTLRAKDE